MDQPKRKHRATGKKAPGGARAGAGRPEGSGNALGYGEVKALKVAGLRIPEGASEQARALADRAQERIIAVMEGEVSHFQAGHVLKAATRLREEVCGPLAQRVEVSGSLSLEQLVAVAGAAKPSQEEEVAKSGEESVALPSEAADTEHV